MLLDKVFSAVKNSIINQLMTQLKVTTDVFYKFHSCKSTGELIPKCRSDALKQKRAAMRSKIQMLAKQIYQLRYDTEFDAYQLKQLTQTADSLYDQAANSIRNIEVAEKEIKQTVLHDLCEEREMTEEVQQQQTTVYSNLPMIQPICLSDQKVKDEITFQNSDRSTEIQIQIHDIPFSSHQYQQSSLHNKTLNQRHDALFLQIPSKQPNLQTKLCSPSPKRTRQGSATARKAGSQTYVNFFVNSLLIAIVLSIILILAN